MSEQRLTKYEIVRIIGVRATQIAQGAQPFVNVSELIDPVDIAQKEFDEKKIPFTVIRRFPDETAQTIDL
uniref:DNA-directed RNA polymerase n=1 Tax=viral metagenome TaxID=1070528 RepID=A0A6C0EL22_9ZZZZ